MPSVHFPGAVRMAAFAIAMMIILTGFVNEARADDAAFTAEARPPQWQEQRQDAASFASDWLTDLDNRDYAAAAVVYTVDADKMESQKLLQSIRAELGELSSRTFQSAQVIAAANDSSEYKVLVEYVTEFSRATVVERVEVLLWPKSPVVLAYIIEKH